MRKNEKNLERLSRQSFFFSSHKHRRDLVLLICFSADVVCCCLFHIFYMEFVWLFVICSKENAALSVFYLSIFAALPPAHPTTRSVKTALARLCERR